MIKHEYVNDDQRNKVDEYWFAECDGCEDSLNDQYSFKDALQSAKSARWRWVDWTDGRALLCKRCGKKEVRV